MSASSAGDSVFSLAKEALRGSLSASEELYRVKERVDLRGAGDRDR